MICHKKELSSLFLQTRANTQQVLPMQIALFRYDEWMWQEINDKNFT